MKYFIIALFLLTIKLSAQEQDIINKTDSIINIKIDYLPLTKSTKSATLLSLAFPGLGQIYVESYWKASVFIGGAGYLWYRISSNHIDYKNYRKQLNQIENKSSFEYRTLEGQMTTAVDNRDLTGLYLLGVYILAMVDAYADAHLFDFKINSNLSYNINPTFDLMGNPYIKMGLLIKL